MAVGKPKWTISFIVRRSRRILPKCSRMTPPWRLSRISASTMLSTCEITVASAAPSTPIFRTAIKKISSTTFVIELIIR